MLLLYLSRLLLGDLSTPRTKLKGHGLWTLEQVTTFVKQQLFETLKHIDKPTPSSLADGSALFATGYRLVAIRIQGYCLCIETLYVPGLTYNLLSVGALSDSNHVTFGQGRCFLELQNDNIFTLALQKNGLYYVV